MRDITDDPSPTRHIDDTYERLFVIGVFVFMSVALYVYIWKFGRNVPFWDDWELVPVLTGHAPLTLSWLWTPHNEHTIPVVRIVMYGIWQLTGDLRVVMMLTNTLLCGGVWALIATTRRLRGHASFTDAVYPLALLNWGLFENQIFAIQFFFISVGLLVVALVLLGIGDRTLGPVRALAMAGCLVGIPLFGAIGLAMLPCLLLWVAVVGIRSVRSDDAALQRSGYVLLAGCVAAIAAALASVAVLPVSATSVHRGTVVEMVRTGTEMLSTSISQAGQKLWPFSALGTLAAVAVTIGFAVRTAWRDASRWRSVSLLVAGMGSFLALVAAIGYGRGGMTVGQGFSNRYAFFSSLLLCLCYLGFSLHVKGGLGRFLRTGVLLALTAALVTNSWAGIVYGIDRADRADALIEAIESGAPPDVAAARFATRIYPVPQILSDRLEMLRATRSGPYASDQAFPPDSPCREIDVPMTRLGVHQIYVDDEIYRGVGNDPFVVFTLPEAVYVCGIRIRFRLTNPSLAAPAMQVYWANSEYALISEGRRYTSVDVERTAEVQERIVWIYGALDQLRIDPDQQPCTFEIEAITFLTRETPR